MNRTSDASAVLAVIREYEEGTRTRDTDRLRAIFHPNAVMSGYLGPNLLVGAPDPFYAHLEANPVDDGVALYTSTTTSVSVTGKTATATTVEDNLFGMSFVNAFHLIGDGGAWTITAKLFHHD